MNKIIFNKSKWYPTSVLFKKFPLGEVRENMLDQLNVVLDCVDYNVWLLLLLWLSYDLRDQLNFIFPCIQALKSLAHTSTQFWDIEIDNQLAPITTLETSNNVKFHSDPYYLPNSMYHMDHHQSWTPLANRERSS
jgi:hypothetical protein